MAPGYRTSQGTGGVRRRRSTKTGGHGPRLSPVSQWPPAIITSLNEDRGPWPPVIWGVYDGAPGFDLAQRRPGAMAPGYLVGLTHQALYRM